MDALIWDWRHKDITGREVVVLLNRRGKSEGGRGRQAAERGVGMEVFRDSLWTDSDMGTHTHPNEA